LKIGQIVSGNQVSKTTFIKSMVQKRYPKALSVEMEGSALADVGHWFDKPAFVLRGICDTGASDKDKIWQPYAAAAAAAVLGELLKVLK